MSDNLETNVEGANEGNQSSQRDEYAVGYKKPPKQTQFKPGQSGNPKGRPVRSKNMVTLIENELDIEVMINEQGQRSVLSKREAIVKRLVNDAASGNQAAMRTLLNMTGSDPEIDPSEVVQQSDLIVLERFSQKLISRNSESSSSYIPLDKYSIKE